MTIGPTDGNLYALRQREAEREAWEDRFIDCPECGGTGEIEEVIFGNGNPETTDYDWFTCDRCGGTGEVERDDYDE